MKRLTQWLIAFFMVAAVCFPAIAVQAAQPAEDTETIITVTNGPAGGTVTAYPILVGKYNENGLVGYMPANQAVAAVFNQVDGLSSAAQTVMTHDDVLKVLNPETASAISPIRSQISPSYPMDPVPAGSTTYQASVPAGAYIVVVEDPGDSARVYNVGMVSANWTGAGHDAELSGGNVDLESTWGTTQHLKSQEVTLDKSMTDLDSDDTENGAAFDQNEQIHFTVTTAIPNYSSSLYTSVTYKITDTLSQGLTLLVDDSHPVTVTVGSKEITAGTDTYTLTAADGGTTLTADFASAFTLANIGQPVVLSYYAAISGDQYNFNGTSNTVKLDYSNNPADASDTKSLQDQTYQYSFAIDGEVNGTGSKVNEELVKVNESFTSVSAGTPIPTTQRLQGAEFGIWKGTSAAGTPLQTAISDENGLLNFTGLDTGTYTIKETKAPSGYSLNENPIDVVISAQYAEDGKMTSYTITINGTNTSSYTVDYTSVPPTAVSAPGNTSFPIQNTQIPKLPSTGSTGVIVLTASGAVLMGAAAAYVAGRRRKGQNQE